ncbi:FAD binding domain-containing protein [Elsinoe ampelina]|uniref:FAD binding domain-containing protein n=1 Tax=Elsinoe ampelina TaxID=302913 RepID=A0A6A6GJV9_9PEZI|nr:FAD binding domain-containing protein [Elsinoe ampelina]
MGNTVSTSISVSVGGASLQFCWPGQTCWPTSNDWSQFNATVGGRLIATVPIGSPCHDPTYDAAACDALKASWFNPLTHIASSSSIMQPYFANQSCDPFTDRAKPCTLGNYVAYAVKARNADDVAATVKFADKYNIPFIVRNTGHDFLGRSTAANALAVWTQDLKEISFDHGYSDKHYTGLAATVGAGVVGYELVEAAHKQNYTVLTGECATVGVAGGFTQGGGHGALSTAFGLGADQTLSFEVVTTGGQIVTASPTKNSDLYWALSGGGGGTYGIVTKVTVRAHQAQKVGGAAMQLLAARVTPDQYAAAVSSFHELLPGMIDKGAMVVYILSAQYLVIKPVTVWNSNATYVRDVVLKPFTDALAANNITVPIGYSELSYRDHYDRYFGPLPRGAFEIARYQFGGRLIPRTTLTDQPANFHGAISKLLSSGVLLAGSAGNYAAPAGAAPNAVLPAWRKASIQLQLITGWNSTAPWATMEAAQKKMTDEFMPLIEGVTPGSGAYLNEADWRQKNWQDAFFGSNYDRLLKIKKVWDPKGILKGEKLVGSA